jgi:hypothetical protein
MEIKYPRRSLGVVPTSTAVAMFPSYSISAHRGC